ncbi:SDR family oxidoreductase [Pseudoxanthobacter sp.]|uniref:SDR family oxidoreductase n=1 Tax=Pseudoxanthobacter sp. TaxID=1925742 RepID=UPI002FE30A8D
MTSGSGNDAAGCTPARTALVTGGGRRIGRAIAADLAAHGWAVAVQGRESIAEAEALARAITDSGGRAVAVRGDAGDPAAAPSIVAAAEAALGPLGLLVNNAAMFDEDDFATMDIAGFNRHLGVNLVAPLMLAQAFAARLPQDGRGLIVNMIDQRVWKPTPRHFTYSVAKAALWSATRTMAQALAPQVRVIGIGPGPTLPSPRQDAAGFARQVAALPLGHGPDLAEFGRAIRFFADSPSLTGQMIALDGGQHLAWETPDVVGIEE